MKRILGAAAVAVAFGMTLTAAPPAMAAGHIPKGFLLYEKEAAKHHNDDEARWEVSRKTGASFAVNPCEKATLGRSGRMAAGTATYTAVPDYMRAEQVILYNSARSAKKALRDLRAAVAECRKIGTGQETYRFTSAGAAIGDEAVKITGQAYYGKKFAVGGQRALVTRRANAVVVYNVAGEWGKPAKSDFSRQLKDTKKMLVKICTIADCD
ncbi:hypothetical protein [Sphaerimonospora thailandensis]|uniref:PknH-like protein n=1 Tax=Sphaerimonospora thailandensis TaxID=795644 RepID=A0A8J3RBY3_9ACTN|nr:hypothetical protein [Sphaerimonospora thailandensis]GIH71004.1 hypothetical protein Mth01_32570 [Sphaerimonospora thailandensis]